MTKERFTELLAGFIRQTLTRDEIAEFLQSAQMPAYQEILGDMLDKDLRYRLFTGLTDREQAGIAFDTLAQKIGIAADEKSTTAEGTGSSDFPPADISRKARTVRLALRWAAAAVIVLLAGGAYLFFNRSLQAPETVGVQPSVYTSDAMPGSNRATLTLANGNKIGLDTIHNGLLAEEGNTKIVHSGKGQLNYQAMGASPAGKEIAYNILSTPRGGQYQLILPDGSRVWLNAASSIRYPTVFSGHERKVEVSGEAYFEVAANALMPFRVTGKGMTVEVLGTHFNVNAYDDEPAIRTTLSEGRVKVTGSVNSQVLSPGEQALLYPSGEIQLEKEVDLEKTLAWKNDQFIFERDDLPAILRQLARWYDVEITYQGNLKPYHFSGILSRTRNASDVLHMLEATGNIHFDITGKKIIVKP